MTVSRQLLLLDLDGVVVTERAPAGGGASQILLLHEGLPHRLATLQMPIAILTHRSRREARRILRSAGIDPRTLVGLFAAEDLFLAGLSLSSVGQLLRRGLRKDLILPVVRKRFGIEARDVIFVDDRIDNIDDLSRAGLGLGLHAPSSEDPASTSLVSFDFDEVLHAIHHWDPETPRRVALQPIDFEWHPWRSTGIDTSRDSGHLFNRARVVGSAIRKWAF